MAGRQRSNFSEHRTTKTQPAAAFRQAIRIALADQGLTQQRVANAAEIHQPRLSAFLCGRKPLTLVELSSLLPVLQLKVRIEAA